MKQEVFIETIGIHTICIIILWLSKLLAARYGACKQWILSFPWPILYYLR
jgi:hypothetical protein